MFFALLTTISAPHPTATPSPTAFPISIAQNLTDLPLWLEALGIVASILLGGAALFISLNAYRFAKKQQEKEEEMRKREAKIAVMDKSYDIFYFFTNEIYHYDFFNSDSNQLSKFNNRLFEIRFTAIMLFKDEIRIAIEDLITLIFEVSQSFNQQVHSKTEKHIMDYYQKIAEEYKFEIYDGTNKIAALNTILSYVQGIIDNTYGKYRLNL